MSLVAATCPLGIATARPPFPLPAGETIAEILIHPLLIPRYSWRKLGPRVCELGSEQGDDKQIDELNFLSARDQECAADSISEGALVLSPPWLRWEGQPAPRVQAAGE